jgi:dinuclear metal center YbgI/SA1388 family protein
MISIKDIINYLEGIAPLAYQESYDNAGLMTGEATTLVKGVLICLDITEAVLEEAQATNCNLIIAHHPILFKPLKKLTGSNHIERCIIQAIRQEIAIYVIHTNLDNVIQGVNQQLAQQLGLQQLKVLLPKPGTWSKLTTFIPHSAVDPVLQALHHAGAGHMGEYSHCSFVSTGDGRFKPSKGANPYIGVPEQIEKVTEYRAEVVFPSHLSQSIVAALKQAHPYEEVAYYIQELENPNPSVGAGMIGEFSQELSSNDFLQYVKNNMKLPYIRHSMPIGRVIKKVAICGGSGGFLIQEAKKQQADAFITADLKYHDFFNAEGSILLADIGHYESEIATKELIYSLLSEKFTSIAFLKCQTTTNPVYYC